ncbi:DNA cytosine methyltransferase [Haladaptatus sp. F3-133]|uniref:DNA (cytosine-5-)-methyltransferase n=1 Tax=Halorutilus salinus TaxID=2487751 RepID=A0A9Q4GH22_9EURY|nr:DNA cytosine methyltransferase [Halorutilus salinus]MCX2819739.1 DNA cytosine methyltransferase [Halorutilus salinus]
MEAIDLFCGCGGFSHGIELSGIEVLYGIDIEEKALKTFDTNHSKAEAICYDISEEVPAKIAEEDFDVVFGSPPCQGFSHAKGERNETDERNNLVFDFVRWIDVLQPEYVIMENVSGIKNISGDFLEQVRERYEDAGYEIEDGVLNSAEFGVPQSRKRYFTIGVRDDVEDYPRLPEPTHRLPDDTQATFDDLEMKEETVLVGEALSDLPEPVSEDKTAKLLTEPQNRYQEWVRNGEEVHNHVAKHPNEDDMGIVERIPEGKMYRSSRFGDMYVQAWELFEDRFSEEEQNALWFISRHRTRKSYKATDKNGPDYVPLEKIEAEDEAVRSLFENGWLRRKTDYGGHDETYDINSKSGVRPKYMRLDRNDVSNTLDTHSFSPREKLHPTENRGLSLREGARIQSFPDSFVFHGSFSEIAEQIGNAVPPLLSYRVGRFVMESAGVETDESAPIRI